METTTNLLDVVNEVETIIKIDGIKIEQWYKHSGSIPPVITNYKSLQ